MFFPESRMLKLMLEGIEAGRQFKRYRLTAAAERT